MERREHTEIRRRLFSLSNVNTPFLKFMSNLITTNITFLRCFYCIKSWLLYNVCFCKAALFSSGLVFSYKLAEKVFVAVFITYFTEYSSTDDIRKAAAYTNFQEGLSASLVVFMVYISEAFPDHYMIIIFCLIFTYTSGMAIFAIAVSETLVVSMFELLSIIGLILVAVGRAGLRPCIRGFTVNQLRAHEPDQEHVDVDRVMAREQIWWRVAWTVGSVASIPLFSMSWKSTFIILTTVMAMAFLAFWLGKNFYHKTESPAATRFTCMRVVKAALLNWHHIQYPSSPDHLFIRSSHENDVPAETIELWPQVKWLRWLDKAAVVKSTLEQNQQLREGRLFSVREVQETKYILKMVPMWFAFPALGLVLSVGNTFTAEQATDLKFPNHLIYLLLLQSISREMVFHLSSFLLEKWHPKSSGQKQNMIRIWAGMLLSILCCAVAWRVEAQRLHKVAELDYTFDTIPMSIWWLAPQLCLLGLIEGLAVYGLNDFTTDDDHLSLSMQNFLSAINEFVVTGIGSAINILFLYFPNTAFFGSTLDDSRLDWYYKYLTLYGPALNCAYLLLISTTIYRCSAAGAHENSQSQVTINGDADAEENSQSQITTNGDADAA